MIAQKGIRSVNGHQNDFEVIVFNGFLSIPTDFLRYYKAYQLLYNPVAKSSFHIFFAKPEMHN
jgi:hypothetical protein